MDKIASKSEIFFGADTVKAPEPKLEANLFSAIDIHQKNLWN